MRGSAHSLCGCGKCQVKLFVNSSDFGLELSGSCAGSAYRIICETLASQSELFSGIADSPNCVRPVVRDQQRTVCGHCDSYRAAPDVAVVDYEAGKEIFVLAAGVSGLM